MINSIRAIAAMVVKEYSQMRRDRTTLAMIIGIPVMQILLFGFAINLNPRDLPAVVFSYEHNDITRSLLQKIENTGYVNFVYQVRSREAFQRYIKRNKAKLGITLERAFASKLAKGGAKVLLAVDATNPSTTAPAITAVKGVIDAMNFELAQAGNGSSTGVEGVAMRLVVQNRYNPELKTSVNMVPGLVGIILAMTLIVFTAIAVTKEVEVGTMESLLVMPIKPYEIMLGKIIPYIFIGFIQLTIILAVAWLFLGIVIAGSVWLLMLCVFVFIVACLAAGYTFSTIARNQLQATQMTFMFLLPNILLSGFMFPFEGMPMWAKVIGEVLPVTHFLRMIRGIMLKDVGIMDITYDFFALVIFSVVVGGIALVRFRGRLD